MYKLLQHWALFLIMNTSSLQLPLHSIPLPFPNSYLIVNPHPEADVGNRTRQKRKGNASFICYLMVLKKKKRRNLMFTFKLHQNSCIGMFTGKCPPCSLRVNDQVGWAVSQLRWLRNTCLGALACALLLVTHWAPRIQKSHVIPTSPPYWSRNVEDLPHCGEQCTKNLA